MTRESLIINCLNATNILKQKKLFESNLEKPLVKLFESAINFKRGSNFIGIEDSNGEILANLNESNQIGLVNSYSKQNPDEIIQVSRNNIYAYLKRLDESFNAENEEMTMLFESVDSLKEVRDILHLIIEKLDKQNDFELITNNTVLNVKMFKKDINVCGFNVFDIETINEFRDKKIHHILYDMNNNSLIIFCDGIIYSYYIKTDQLLDMVYSYYDNIYYNITYTNDYKQIEKDFSYIFRSELKSLYLDKNFFMDKDLEFNNVFNDTKNTKILQDHLAKIEAKESKVKDNYNNGYLTR